MLKVKNDHRSKFSNYAVGKKKPEKIQSLKGIRTRDLGDTGAMLYQLSYEATHWERGQLRVRFFKKIQEWILKSERIRKRILCFFIK